LWRDKETFRVFQERIIPELVARRREEGKLADYEASISSIAFSPD
jgi:chemotaxis methyl-accepting protein methylase